MGIGIGRAGQGGERVEARVVMAIWTRVDEVFGLGRGWVRSQFLCVGSGRCWLERRD